MTTRCLPMTDEDLAIVHTHPGGNVIALSMCDHDMRDASIMDCQTLYANVMTPAQRAACQW